MKKSVELMNPTALQIVVCYAVWLCLAAMSIWLLLTVRNNLSLAYAFTEPHPFAMHAFQNFSFVIMALVIVVALYLIEHYVRTGLKKDVFWPRVAKVVVIEFIVLVLSFGAQFAVRALTLGA